MKTLYQVTVIKPVTDYLRADVLVEAESAEEAETLVQDMDLAGKFEFSHCGDCLESTTYETALAPAQSAADDGGQDRESYSDDQDRESYLADD